MDKRWAEHSDRPSGMPYVHPGDESFAARKIPAELRDADIDAHEARWAWVGKRRVARRMCARELASISRRFGATQIYRGRAEPVVVDPH